MFFPMMFKMHLQIMKNENSKLWKQNQPQDIFDQMHECMHYMAQEYSTAEMPLDLVERSQKSGLNPDAQEFQPSWSSPPTSTDNRPYYVQSWQTYEVIKQTQDS